MNINFNSASMNTPVKFNGGVTGTGGTEPTESSINSREELTAHVWQAMGDRFDSALETVDRSLSQGDLNIEDWSGKLLEKFRSARSIVDNMTRLAAAYTTPY